MGLPFGHPDTPFARFLQESPADHAALAREFKALARSRQIKTPAQLLQVVMRYRGLDAALRDVAGQFTLLEERLTDTAIHRRLKACGPWVKALLGRLMGEAAHPLLAGPPRFILIDGSTVQGPGATGTQYRLHLALDLVRLEWSHGRVTDEHTGERLSHYPLQDGDVATVDRGYNPVEQWLAMADRGVALGIRDNPHGVRLDTAEGTPVDLAAVLREPTATDRCLPAQVRTKRRALLNGYLHARCLPPARAAEARRRSGRDGNRLDQPRRATPWRLVKRAQREPTEAIQAASQWNWRRWSAALQVMQERPRRRALQTVPERIRHLIADYQARGVSNI